jgi:hypothetical protein
LVCGFIALDTPLRSIAQVSTPAELNIDQFQNAETPKTTKTLYNINLQTAIGLGDEMAGIIDGHGELDSRNAKFRLVTGAGSEDASEIKWKQSLYDAYLPIVSTESRSARGRMTWDAYASDVAETGAEYVEIYHTDLSYRVELLFPYTTHVDVSDGKVCSGEQLLAVIPGAMNIKSSQARYNFLTPTRETYSLRSMPGQATRHYPGIDPAFSGGRTSILFRPLVYRFPVEADRTYHVVLGLMTGEIAASGANLLKLSVNNQSLTVDMAAMEVGKPFLQAFAIHASGSELRISSETDPSSTSPYRRALLNGIWIFEEAADPEQIALGKLSDRALYYVRCGEELPEEATCSVSFDYGETAAPAPRRVCLPYSCKRSSSQVLALQGDLALKSAREKWNTVLQEGAQFITGDPRLDHLYNTSLINVFLLRTKYASTANSGEDLYVLKPGAGIYDAFWYRDGAYLAAALDVAGHSLEAEKSLRLFWQTGLPGNLAAFEQQQGGSWQSPLMEYDGQGQALWALVHHAKFSGNRGWLRNVYPNIRRGALWIKSTTEQNRFVTEDGARPIYYGLLPIGEGEAIGRGYNYYHDYWAFLGLQMAFEAAQVLNEEDDLKWIRETRDAFSADLLSSVRQSFERIGEGKYIPATPFESKSQCDIWGSLAALYPTRFLDPQDPMMTRTLDLIQEHSTEGEYKFFTKNKIWTYITADWAMCYLLRDELPMFHALYDGYVAHASPTNAWIEEIYLDTRIGTGWAAGQYVHLHRNALVFEDEDVLHLCWGAKELWFANGITVLRAPTKFGIIDFKLRRVDTLLNIDYKFTRNEQQDKCRCVQLHFPISSQTIGSIRVNGKVRALAPGQRALQLE